MFRINKWEIRLLAFLITVVTTANSCMTVDDHSCQHTYYNFDGKYVEEITMLSQPMTFIRDYKNKIDTIKFQPQILNDTFKFKKIGCTGSEFLQFYTYSLIDPSLSAPIDITIVAKINVGDIIVSIGGIGLYNEYALNRKFGDTLIFDSDSFLPCHRLNHTLHCDDRDIKPQDFYCYRGGYLNQVIPRSESFAYFSPMYGLIQFSIYQGTDSAYTLRKIK